MRAYDPWYTPLIRCLGWPKRPGSNSHPKNFECAFLRLGTLKRCTFITTWRLAPRQVRAFFEDFLGQNDQRQFFYQKRCSRCKNFFSVLLGNIRGSLFINKLQSGVPPPWRTPPVTSPTRLAIAPATPSKERKTRPIVWGKLLMFQDVIVRDRQQDGMDENRHVLH